MRMSGRVLLVFAVLLAGSTARAQTEPIVIGGGDSTATGPTVCEREFNDADDAAGLGNLIRSLCRRGDADGLTAAYLLSASTGDPNNASLLRRARDLGNPSSPLLWLIIAQTDCASPIGGCKAAGDAVRTGEMLVRRDPANAMAWFALAYARDQFLAPAEQIDDALTRAGSASRVHDYGFDLAKLAINSSDAIAPGANQSHPNTLRWQLVAMTMQLGVRFAVWTQNRCSTHYDPGDPDRIKACDAAKVQFKHGDSMLTLSGNTAALEKMRAALTPRPGVSEEAFATVMLETGAAASNEREWLTHAAARLGTD